MSADYFLDTSVFVHSFDNSDARKRHVATSLIERALAEDRGVVSYQVVQEFVSLATRKFARTMSADTALTYVDGVLEPLCGVHSSIALYRRALSLHARWRLSSSDCLIVAAALEAGCDILYSGELQDGQAIESLTVVDPFVEGRQAHE